MHYEDRQRGGPAHRKAELSKLAAEKSGTYSPSARYLYASQQPQHQHEGRPPNRPNRDQHQQRRQGQGGGGGNQNQQFDRLAKQNDVIIRLLKEIRDRLPASPTAVYDVDGLRPENQEPAQSGDQSAAEVITQSAVGVENDEGGENGEAGENGGQGADEGPVDPVDEDLQASEGPGNEKGSWGRN